MTIGAVRGRLLCPCPRTLCSENGASSRLCHFGLELEAWNMTFPELDPELTNYFLNIQMFRQIWSDLLVTEQFYLQVISVFQVFCQAIADRTTPPGLVWLGVHLKVTFLDSSYILSWGRGTQRFPSYSAWLSKSPDVVVCRPGYMRYPFHWGSVLPESLKMGW